MIKKIYENSLVQRLYGSWIYICLCIRSPSPLVIYELYVIQSNVIKFVNKLRKGADGTMVFSNNKTNPRDRIEIYKIMLSVKHLYPSKL